MMLITVSAVFLTIGLFQAVGSPRIYTNPYLTRDGAWNDLPAIIDDQTMVSIGESIGAEIDSLRTVHMHADRSSLFFGSAAVMAIISAIMLLIQRKRIS